MSRDAKGHLGIRFGRFEDRWVKIVFPPSLVPKMARVFIMSYLNEVLIQPKIPLFLDVPWPNIEFPLFTH